MTSSNPFANGLSGLNRRPLSRILRAALRLFYQALLVSCVLTGLAFLGKYAWVVDLTSHFRMQYLLLQLLGLLVLVITRARFRWMAPVVLCAGLNLGFLLPYLPPVGRPSEAVAASSGTPVRVLHMNVLKYGNDFDGVTRFIRQANPDVLSLQELDAKWETALQERGVLKAFSFQMVRKQSEIALYTRLPVLNSEVIAAGPGQMAALHARVLADGKPLSVLAMHPPAPVNAAYALRQRYLFVHMADVYQTPGAIEKDSVLMGDLNATPFSWPLRHFMDQTGLQDIRQGRGYLPSWPSFAPMFWIPIDHMLLGGHWQVRRLQIGPAVGSDHLPVLAELRRLK